ncbi:MAG: DEAD/DEAH box helicase [Desulfovibrionales bacterium]
MTFQPFGFHPTITSNIKAQGFVAPTPIQEQAMPAILQGRDVMGLAQTGTGKTAAFMLPILQRILDKPAPRGAGVRALVIAPTRELAEQIHRCALDLGRKIPFRSVTVYGGVGMNPQTRALRQGVELVVACPGRLLDHMRQGNVRFDKLETLVLDEADHMFDMGFLPDIKKILTALPAQRQSLLFSATMPSSIRGLANEILHDPVTVSIGSQQPVNTVSHAIYPVGRDGKIPMLMALLHEHQDDSMIVFTRTKHTAKKLAARLCATGHKATSLQGNLSQRQRQSAMDGFRKGSFRVLVATDIAARGIDVSKVGHVVNFDMPGTAEAYTHRIGRTGRAEQLGQAHTLVTGEDRYMVRAVERILGQQLTRKTIEGIEPAVLENTMSSAPRREGQRTVSKSGKPSTPWHARNQRQAQPSKRQKDAKKSESKRIFL